MKLNLKLFCYLTVSSLFLGILLSGFTNSFLNNPATKIMKMARGDFGFTKGKKEDTGEIPTIFYPRLGRAVYYPMAIANRAVKFYKKAMRGEEKKNSLNIFYRHVEWLMNNLRIYQHHDFEYGLWESDFPYPYGIYDLEVPWRSGMVQGSGIYALTKAYELTGKIRYIDSAKKALMSFFVDVKDGGVTYKDKNDEWWFEEYAGSKKDEPRVFNGAIYALLDIFYYWEITNDKDANVLIEKGLNSIKRNIERYDSGWWTYYDAMGNIATKHYHLDHIKLTLRLYEMTNEKIFLEYSQKWSNYKDNYFVREFLKQKPDYHDIVILILNIIFAFLIVSIIYIFFRFTTKK